MSVLRVDVTLSEIERVFEKVTGRSRSTDLNYNDFLDLLGFNNSNGGKSSSFSSSASSRSMSTPSSNSASDELLSNIRRKLEDHVGSGAQSTRRIKEIFAEIDADNSGTIDKKEFSRAMSVLRVDLTSRDVDKVFDRFDRTGNNVIDYTEFLELLGFNAVNTVRKTSRY
eukprot:CAMPEP_0170085030 /NCGR_PEP_ID=MMETSP0019_2-20121128/20033_1 /TAXON_ID=98059 /ORGANISM="Dinobryon sp., Strain UTEXLB2267" /LENGTH=168 /DNA_ID=CAMNT_0010301323 /DNA_START=15 /DNA_END=521 /DNA_ORIENTATION=-